jgi:hypothetical protein
MWSFGNKKTALSKSSLNNPTTSAFPNTLIGRPGIYPALQGDKGSTMRYDVYKDGLGMDPASIINFLFNDAPPSGRGASFKFAVVKFFFVVNVKLPRPVPVLTPNALIFSGVISYNSCRILEAANEAWNTAYSQ